MAVSEFVDFMPETVNIKARTGLSVSGVPTYEATGTDYSARVELKNRLVMSYDGREVMARGRVFLATVVSIPVTSKVTLPSGYTPVSPPILAVNPVSDESGPHHTVLEIG